MTRRKADILEEQRAKAIARARSAPKGEKLRSEGAVQILTTLALKAETGRRG